MKHRDVVIEFGDIVNLWASDDTTAEQHAGIQPECYGANPQTYDSTVYVELCLVSWPEHVLSPMYNCDCSIEFITEPTAIRLLSCGEAEARSGLPWRIQRHEKRHKIVAALESQLQLAEEAEPEDTVSGLVDAAEAVLKEFCGEYTTKE